MQERVEVASSILVVESDAEIGERIARYLLDNGFETEIVADGLAMEAALRRRQRDLVLLDLALPGEDGLAICRQLSIERNIPNIVVTAQIDEVDRILALEMGADDCVVAPFNFRELLARIRAVLRRAGPRAAIDDGKARTAYLFAGWTVDLKTREAITPLGDTAALTAAEFDLLHALCENPNRVLTRDQLVDMTHGALRGPFQRSIDVLVSRLRQKIEADPKNPAFIRTIRSEGYLFAAQVSKR